jgi:hypothetical protein
MDMPGGATLLCAAVLAGSLAGCGAEEPERLTADESFEVSNARMAFANTVLDGSMYSQTLDGVDALIRLCRRNPDAIYEPGEGDDHEELTMVQVVEDGANTLREYRPEQAAKLDRVADNRCGE